MCACACACAICACMCVCVVCTFENGSLFSFLKPTGKNYTKNSLRQLKLSEHHQKVSENENVLYSLSDFNNSPFICPPEASLALNLISGNIQCVDTDSCSGNIQCVDTDPCSGNIQCVDIGPLFWQYSVC